MHASTPNVPVLKVVRQADFSLFLAWHDCIITIFTKSKTSQLCVKQSSLEYVYINLIIDIFCELFFLTLPWLGLFDLLKMAVL